MNLLTETEKLAIGVSDDDLSVSDCWARNNCISRQELPLFLARLDVKHVQVTVARTDHHAVAGNDG